MSSPAKSISILGATGSVGKSAADVIASTPESFDVALVTAHSDAKTLAEVAVRLRARRAVIARTDKFNELKDCLQSTGIEAAAGCEVLNEAAGEQVDFTLAAISGIAGLRPVMTAIQNSRCVAIANKEPLVAAGALIVEEAVRRGTVLLPVDSEHNAIFQVFDSDHPEHIEKIILTASGGPFRTWSCADMKKATPEQALAHPTWSMGRKISVDSATMVNKALEIIEAHYLFRMAPEKIEILVHPESVIHSMVEYRDGSVLAQLGASDMRTPLCHVLAWPSRMNTPGRRLDLKSLRQLSFEEPDFERFPGLKLAYQALKTGPYACIAFNAANEIAVEAFLAGRIGFLGILECICHIMEETQHERLFTLEEIIHFDQTVRRSAESYINSGITRNMAVAL